MAQVDIAGLLTGIPSLQDPMTQGRMNAANIANPLVHYQRNYRKRL